MEHSDRYKQGWEKLKDIDGETGEKVINGLKEISSDLGKFIIKYAFNVCLCRVPISNKRDKYFERSSE